MNESLQESIAKSMEAEEIILPYLHILLEDLWALGSSPEVVIALLEPLNLAKETRVIDLGCGKGAVSVNLAHHFGYNITGIDANKNFLESARNKAIEYGVDRLCNFEAADIRTFVKKSMTFDVAVYASLGSVLGDYQDIINRLRCIVRPGGFIIIDDCFLKKLDHFDRRGYEYCRSHPETRRQLESWGDKILKEHIISDEDNKAINQGYLEAIQKRGHMLIQKEPDLASAIHTYVDNQKEECDIIDQHLTGAIWLIQRSQD